MRGRLASTARRLSAGWQRLRHNNSGAVLIEFAFGLPFVVAIGMTGAELTNFVTTKMRISQLALQVADNASRVGTGTVLSTTQISEAQINDLLTGAGLQASNLDFYEHGRVIVSSLQPLANPNTTNRFLIKWQRCRGLKSTTSAYGVQGTTNLTGITVNGQLVTAPDDGAVIFVEIAYDYQPIIGLAFAKSSLIKETAVMTVRDNRDTTTIVNNATASVCNVFSTT